jgi:hypothetical protein
MFPMNRRAGGHRYRVRIAKSEQSRDGHSEVLADHSTDVSEYKHETVRWGSGTQSDPL